MEKQEQHIECTKTIRAVHDAMHVVGGKWKISIVPALSFGAKRYSEILKDVTGISGQGPDEWVRMGTNGYGWVREASGLNTDIS